MTDSEKLIKILESTESAIYWNSEDKGFIQKIADHLLANGVTFAKYTNVPANPIVPGHDDQYNIAEMSYNNGYAKGCDDSKPKWIPVSERLPEENELVLILCKNGARFVGYCGIQYADFERRWHIKTALNSTKLLNKGRVTHWMPLPEPPKEE